MRGDNRRAHCVYIHFGVGAAVLDEATTSAWGQCQANELAKLTASDAAAGDRFGTSVSVSGDVIVIGADIDDEACPDDPDCNSGSAYVLRFDPDTSSWIEEQKLLASDAAAGDRFGRSVSISGDVALVGVIHDDDAGSSSGSAYVYRFNGSLWLEEAKLTACDGAADDFFGWSVSISGDVAVVGAVFDDEVGTNSGSVYVFRFNTQTGQWNEEAKLTASNAAAYDFFGWSVSTSGDMILIGAPMGNAIGARDSGSAYVYRFDPDTSAWTEQAQLTASDAAAYDAFGSSVSTSGDVALIGSPSDDDAGSGSGSAYVYRFNGSLWLEEAKLTASDAAAYDSFGSSVSTSGDMAVIGARFGDDGGANSGFAYTFRFDGNNWTEKAKLTASDAAAGDTFGTSVSTKWGVAVIGAARDDDACPDDPDCNSGSAYVFGGLSDCNDSGTLDLCDIADGASRDANGNGIPDECECPWDLDGNGSVGILDLLTLLAAWGTDPGGPPDFDGNGSVGILDLLTLLANWGPCL